MNRYLSFFLLIFTFFLKSQEENWLTIFVHGTIGLKASASPGLFFKLLTDNVENSDYARYVECLRHSPRIYSEQAIQEVGLHKIHFNHKYTYRGAYVFAKVFDQMINKCSTIRQNNTYYTFGWSGLLSYKARFKESKLFYESLREKITKSKYYDKNLKIRIVGYSHGGNLALDLAAIRECYYPEDTFNIDELIMIGMPVQNANSGLIYHDIFKKAYNIYSCGDIVQSLDIFAPWGWFSRKKFVSRYCSFPLPDKLTQIGLNFEISKYLRCRNNINWHPKPYCLCSYAPVYTVKAGHFELWLFGWNTRFYNQCFPLYPLPVASLIPLFICWAQPYQGKSINLRILPDHELTLLSVKNGPQNVAQCFFKRQELYNLQQQVEDFRPSQFISDLIKYDL